MGFMIFDEDGNALAATDDRQDALATLREIAFGAPGAEDSFVLFEYDQDGRTVGEALTVFDMPSAPVVTVASEFVLSLSTAADRRASATLLVPWFAQSRAQPETTSSSASAVVFGMGLEELLARLDTITGNDGAA